MKKYIGTVLAFMLTAISVCGCAEESSQNDGVSESMESVTASEETSQTEKETVDFVADLSQQGLHSFLADAVSRSDSDAVKLLNVSDDENIKAVSSDTMAVSLSCMDGELFRRAAIVSCVDPNKFESFYAAVGDMHAFNTCKITDYSDSLTDGDVNITFDGSEIAGLSYGYELFGGNDTENWLKVNAFVKQEPDGSFDIVVDPAYMYNLPVPVCADEHMQYDINGKTALFDCVSFNAKRVYTKDDDGLTAEIDWNYDGYVYASLKTRNLEVRYDMLTGENLSNVYAVAEFELIEEDTGKILVDALLESKGKSDEFNGIYNVLIDNIDLFMEDDVVGINLIDLDFNGTPELLVSKKVIVERPDGFYDDEYADVHIFTIENDGLNYIDTLYNYRNVVYFNSNNIGIKTDENGVKKWFYISRKNLDTGDECQCSYLFTLEGDNISYEPVFVEVPTDDEKWEGYVYYMFGKELEYETFEEEEGPYDEGPWTYYRWNDIQATFGLWELWGFIKQDYCADISPVFDLYGGGLVSGSAYYYDTEKMPIDKRTMEYKLANIVDAYFYGEYDPAEHEYHYVFLGDYAKPVIYLYPEEETSVNVSIDIKDGAVSCSYPEYKNGWNVTTYPDGTIIDNSDGEEYYCLYWEGVGNVNWDMSKGFVVRSEDTAAFLREKLREIGLTPRESNEFIIYWLPLLSKNDCNLITFQTERYEDSVSLDILPVPDSVLRVFMVYAPCEEDTVIEPQEFEKFERNGFTVVEWGGGAMPEN